MVRTIVDCQLIILAVQSELAFADTVSPTSDKGREIRLVTTCELLDTVVSLNNVSYIAILVWHHDSADGATVVTDCYFVTLAISKDVQVGFLTIDSGLEVLPLQTTQIRCFCCISHN